MLGDGLKGPRRESVCPAPWFMGLQPHEPPGSGVYFDPVRPKCNPPPVSSSDEFKDPFSEDTGGGLLEIEDGMYIQGGEDVEKDAEVEIKRGRTKDFQLPRAGKEEYTIDP